MTEIQQQILESCKQGEEALQRAEEYRRKDKLYKCLSKNLRIRIVLTEAIRILKTTGWSKSYTGPNGEVCVSHAIGRASHNLFGEHYRHFPDGILYLRTYLGTQVTQWNDSVDQTRANVILTLARAIRAIPRMNALFTPDEAQEVYEFVSGERNFYGVGGLSDTTIDKLYENFVEEMPYGVMKARTGDPDVWLGDKLSSFGQEGFINWLKGRTQGTLLLKKDIWPFP